MEALAEDQFKVHFKGCAGQSFGAFLTRGVTFTLEGEANDYLGKGLSGGKIIVRPPEGSRLDPSENTIAGNTLLYGATSGEVYINGRAGERFAVRNSGAFAVVEGVGEHWCEYMTGGRVVVLGETGLNFGAGMSGGIAYVFDEHHLLDSNGNLAMIDLDAVIGEEDILELKGLIQNHFRHTGSPKAKKILDGWSESLYSFVKVFPIEYKLVLGKMMHEDLTTRRERAIHA
jgi:glutamate synthase domain-containing protein 3